MAKTNTSSTKKNNKNEVIWAPGMPFDKMNYILMIVGIVVLFIGYVLLSGGGTDDPSKFSEAIFDTRRLVVAPITLVVGFAIEFFAIMLKFNCKAKAEDTDTTTEA